MIDDDAGMVRAYKRMLAGYNATIVQSGAQALEVIASDDRFDLIICDLMMPEMDGPQVYEALRERAPHLLRRIVFCTGGAFTARSREFLAAIDNQVLAKPLRLAKLEQILAGSVPPPSSHA